MGGGSRRSHMLLCMWTSCPGSSLLVAGYHTHRPVGPVARGGSVEQLQLRNGGGLLSRPL